MKKIINLVMLCMSLVLVSFSVVPKKNAISATQTEGSKVIKIYSENLITPNLRNAVWTNEYLIATYAIRYIKITNDFLVEDDAKIGNSSLIEYYPFTMYLNKKKNKILYVVSKYDDVSLGGLYELELSNYALRKVIDSTENISSAVYLGSSDSVIVYYTLGNPIGTNAGYYKLNMNTKERELICDYYSKSLGARQIVNGFDISPDGKTMAIPLMEEYTPPMIGLYDLASRKMQDTIWRFDFALRDLVWVRYNNEGTKLLYSNYSRNAFSMGRASAIGRMGIITIGTKAQKSLSFKPEDTDWYGWVAPCPNWSPDCKHIVYGMAQIANQSGIVSSYRLYIKTNVEEEISGVAGNAELPKVMKLE